APVVLPALAFLLAGLLAVEPIHAADADTKADTEANTEAKADSPKAGRGKDAIPGGPKDQNALWWNDPKMVKDLSLTDEQRNKMGESLKAFREKVPRDRRPEVFHETLVKGNWKEARVESGKLAESADTAVRLRGKLKIDVLSLLSKEQHQKLVDLYPRLIYQPWRRAMREAPAG
ncbi:MAG: hypothetical protein JRH10_21330, partial [Deltaproteobacteria bacterium]|nr:hypothetical protein [Deltaproteobacteria bacterium]